MIHDALSHENGADDIMAIKAVKNGRVAAASIGTTDPLVMATADLAAATTAPQVYAAIKAHKTACGYKRLFALLPAPARAPRKITGPLTVEIVAQCQKALARAKTPEQVAGIVAAYHPAMNGRTERIIGQLIAYQDVDVERIVNG
jgi:hypothetical protein